MTDLNFINRKPDAWNIQGGSTYENPVKTGWFVKPMNRVERRRLSKMSPTDLLRSGHFTPELIEWIEEKQRQGIAPESLRGFDSYKLNKPIDTVNKKVLK